MVRQHEWASDGFKHVIKSVMYVTHVMYVYVMLISGYLCQRLMDNNDVLCKYVIEFDF